MPRQRKRPPAPSPVELLPRLIALEEALNRQAGSKGLAEAPVSAVKLVRDLLSETRACLPDTQRKKALPRLSLNHPASYAELHLIAGQARAHLAAYMAARKLDNPKDAAKIADLRERLTARLNRLAEVRREA